jgi:Protein of unknown function (DUF1588)/Protein of unknown function (DUF1592)/Protein of unknown function (DUF1595)/Protein of unknown function (DUF1585)/Protein of unknown function (DUF1587)
VKGWTDPAGLGASYRRALAAGALIFGCGAPQPLTSDASPNGEGLTSDGGSVSDCGTSTSAQRSMTGRIRRLTRLELENTLSDLLGEEAGIPARSLEPDTLAIGYSTGDERGVSANYVDALKSVAEQAAAKLQQAPESQALNVNCLIDDASVSACARTFIETFGTRALRRPLTQGELDELFVVYTTGRVTVTDTEPSALLAGLAYAVRALLQSPSFIFRTELGVPGGSAASVPLTPFEMATVLSYGLTASPPDAELTLQASSDALSTADQLIAQGQRLLATYPARYARQTERFVREWLAIDLEGPAWKKDVQLYPEADQAFTAALDHETGLFLQEWARDSSFKALMTAPRGFVSQANAWAYGLSNGSSEFTAIDLDPLQRSGILTLPSFLGTFAHAGASSPVLRGVAVMKKFLCLEPPPVPAVVPPLPPADTNGAETTRARYEQHTSVAFCAGCHGAFDPMGFTFEHYDAVGRYREQENGVPIDSRGAIVGGASSVASVADAIELSSLLAASPDVHDCFVRQAYRFTFGRKESEGDACAIDAHATLFGERNLNVRELLLALVTDLASVPRVPLTPDP